MADKISRTWVLIDPEGNRHHVKNLTSWAKENYNIFCPEATSPEDAAKKITNRFLYAYRSMANGKAKSPYCVKNWGIDMELTDPPQICECPKSRYPRTVQKELKNPTGQRPVDLTGQRFGRLTALHPTNKRKMNCIVWHCKCDCGSFVDAPSVNLRNGNTKSCGCWRRYNAILSSPFAKNKSEHAPLVWFNNKSGMYQSFSRRTGKRILIGSFQTEAEAVSAWNAIEQMSDDEFAEWESTNKKKREDEDRGICKGNGRNSFAVYLHRNGHQYHIACTNDKDDAIAIRNQAETIPDDELQEWILEIRKQRKEKKQND